MSELTAAELAKRWGLTEKWLRNQRYLGRGPKYVRRDARVYYSLAAVREYEQKHKGRKRGRKA